MLEFGQALGERGHAVHAMAGQLKPLFCGLADRSAQRCGKHDTGTA